MILQKTVALDRFEGKQAVIRLENGQELLLAKEELSGVTKAAILKEGTVFVLQVLTAEEAAMKQGELARTVINELLAVDERPTHGEKK